MENNDMKENASTPFKKSTSAEPLDQFQPNLAQSTLAWLGFNKFVQMKDHALFLREIIVKIGCQHFKNLVPQNYWTKLQPILAQSIL